MKVLKFWVVLALVSLLAIGCGKKSGLEGKVVDGKGQPIANVKVVASQVQPIKGYEQFEAVTNSDGTFRLNGLFPSSQYVLKPWSDKWTCETALQQDSAPEGETFVMRSPLVIDRAYSKNGGSLVLDLATGGTRFSISSEGVIADSKTGIEWIVGPDRDANYAQAEQWVANCKVMGGGWRMPTRQELRTTYQKGVGERNMDPVFKTTGTWVWAEPNDSLSAWGFLFTSGNEYWNDRNGSSNGRGFGVRSRPQ